MSKKSTPLKKSKKEHIKVKDHTKETHKKVHKKKKTTKNKNVNKNIITINGTGSSGSSSSSIPIPIPFHSSVAPTQPINIFNEPPMERYLPMKTEPIQVQQEIPVKQDTPVKSPIKSPFDKIESKVDTPTKVNIENDIKQRHRVFIEPKTPISINQSDFNNPSIISQMLNQKNKLSNLIPLNTSKSLSNIINNETYDIDQNEKLFSNPFKMYDSDTSISSISNQSKKSNTLSQFHTPTIDNVDYNNETGEKLVDNPLKFYDTDTGSSISSITNKSNKSTDKSTANKSTDKSVSKPLKNIDEYYNEYPNRYIEEYIWNIEAPVKPKRYRRTKEEMIAYRAEQAKIKAEKERIKREKLAEFEKKAKIFFDKYG
jgi:hypothetical protein